MSAEDESGHVLNADFEFIRNEGSKTSRVKHTGHPDHALAREAAKLVSRLSHSIERVRNNNQYAVRRVLHHLPNHIFHDVVISVEQVVAAHTGLTRNSGGDYDDVGIGGIRVIVGAENVGIALLDRHGFKQIKALALRHALDDINEDDISEFF